jgi:hypothetical protein
MDGKQLRQNIAYGFLALYALYGIFGIGMTGLLFSFAIGLIVMSFDQSIEIIVATTILSGLLFSIFGKRIRKDGFQNQTPAPLGKAQDAAAIAKRVEEIAQKNVFQTGPSGVLSSDFVESFADMNSTEQPSNAGSTVSKPAGEKTPAPSSSTPAAITDATVSPQMVKDLPSSNAAAAAAPDAKATEPPAKTQEPAPTTTSGFSDKGTDGMFKLGSIPADAVGGAHIDVGTTLMNALNSLKPDQVKAMTEDTRKLMDTQKSLMGMLTTMKPMLQDGKQLMETFTEMFGKQ